MQIMKCHEILLFLTSFCVCCEGGALISPPGAALACRGDDFELTCNISGRFLQWNFSLIPANETAPMTYTRSLQNSGPNDQQTFKQVIDSTTFLYTRSSAENSVPLISTLSISPVNEALNGVVVNCMDVITSDTASTIIKIIIDSDSQEINITSQTVIPESDGVTIDLQWKEDSSHLSSYHVNIFPQQHVTINFTGTTSVQLKVLYDILYNVTIASIPLCGQSNVTVSTELIYFKCENPVAQVRDSIKVIGYNDSELALEGLNITFMCPLQYILIGTNTSTCMGNGKWEPDPTEVECIEHIFTYANQPYDVTRAIILSSVSTFLVTAVVVFIIGCTSGYCFSQKCKKRANESHPAAEYEDVSQSTEFQLEENVAYSISVP